MMEKGKGILKFVLYLAVVAFSSYLIITYVAQRSQVIGDSMITTLHDDDQLIMDKLTYRFQDPKRFDIIVFQYLYRPKTYYVKRIMGLPGETVQIVDGQILINGKVLEEDYGREVMLDGRKAKEPITLGEDEYFVLGDNRNYSSDSRDSDVGSIKRSQILGKAKIVIWPLNHAGILRHQ